MSKFKNLKVLEVLSETQYYSVVKIKGDKVQLSTDNGENIVVDAKYVDSFLSSAAQFTKEEKITRTELAAVVMSHPRTAMTVCYNKQVKEADVVKEIEETYISSTPKEFSTKLKKAIKQAMNGVERVMVGRHYAGVDAGGRIQFIDMAEKKDPSKDYDTRIRLVDPRTLQYAIVGDVKYIVK